MFEPPARSRPRGRWIGAIAAAATAIAVLVAVLASGDDDEPERTATGRAPSPPARTETSARRVRLEPLGRGGDGTAAIEDERLRLRAALPPLDEEYVVWLYDDVQTAKRLGGLENGERLDVDLPANFRDYRYIDVSAEPPDDNPNHSGASVLRVPVAALE